MCLFYVYSHIKAFETKGLSKVLRTSQDLEVLCYNVQLINKLPVCTLHSVLYHSTCTEDKWMKDLLRESQQSQVSGSSSTSLVLLYLHPRTEMHSLHHDYFIHFCFPSISAPIMKASEIKELLQQRVAYLSGEYIDSLRDMLFSPQRLVYFQQQTLFLPMWLHVTNKFAICIH